MFKVGDFVRIVTEKPADCDTGPGWNYNMDNHLGKYTQVKEVYDKDVTLNRLHLPPSCPRPLVVPVILNVAPWVWKSTWITSIPQPKFKIGETVFVGTNQAVIAGITIDDKGNYHYNFSSGSRPESELSVVYDRYQEAIKLLT